MPIFVLALASIVFHRSACQFVEGSRVVLFGTGTQVYFPSHVNERVLAKESLDFVKSNDGTAI